MLSVIALGRVVGSTPNVVSIGVVMSALFVVDDGILDDNDDSILNDNDDCILVTMVENTDSDVEWVKMFGLDTAITLDLELVVWAIELYDVINRLEDMELSLLTLNIIEIDDFVVKVLVVVVGATNVTIWFDDT